MRARVCLRVVWTRACHQRLPDAGPPPLKIAGQNQPSPLPPPLPPPAQVRAAVMQLEHELYGNELPAGTLPVEVLQARVAHLCEEVGVACEQPSGSLTPADMARLVGEVRAMVGVPAN